MAIDYLALSEMYRPAVIETLLVGEAPPPNGKSYFYLPKALGNKRSRCDDTSLPATIFYHYFQKMPGGEEEYNELLLKLKERQVFLVDIYEAPIKVRGSKEGVSRIKDEIPKLRERLKPRRIELPDENIIFLLARRNYKANIRQEFPTAKLETWKAFRMRDE